jgi:hypothetical protein
LLHATVPVTPHGQDAGRVLTTDLSNHGHRDFVVTAYSFGEVHVYLGNGDGTCALPIGMAFFRGHALAMFDINNDGLPDYECGTWMTNPDDAPRDTFFVDAEIAPAEEDFSYQTRVVDTIGDRVIGTVNVGLPRLPEVPCP